MPRGIYPRPNTKKVGKSARAPVTRSIEQPRVAQLAVAARVNDRLNTLEINQDAFLKVPARVFQLEGQARVVDATIERMDHQVDTMSTRITGNVEGRLQRVEELIARLLNDEGKIFTRLCELERRVIPRSPIDGQNEPAPALNEYQQRLADDEAMRMTRIANALRPKALNGDVHSHGQPTKPTIASVVQAFFELERTSQLRALQSIMGQITFVNNAVVVED